MRSLIFGTLISFFIFGCGQDLSTRTSTGRVNEVNLNGSLCNCPTTEKKVCAYNGSSYVEVLNACVAQCNNLYYQTGSCTAMIQNNCNSNSGIVCGEPPCESGSNCPAKRYYSDECALRFAEATLLDDSECE